MSDAPVVVNFWGAIAAILVPSIATIVSLIKTHKIGKATQQTLGLRAELDKANRHIAVLMDLLVNAIEKRKIPRE